MSHSILITGGSGYLGGSLLAQLSSVDLPPHGKIYALVRTEEQSDAVRKYGLTPLSLDLTNEESVTKSIVDNGISIIYFLIDATKSDYQIPMIKALAKVKKTTGQEVHFLHTSGAKLFSEHAGLPTDRPILDTDPALFDMQHSSKPPLSVMAQALNTNNVVIETAKAYGVRSYIFIPCIVYGEGLGFGNRTSIQTVAIVKAAQKLRRVYNLNPKDAIWPVSHIHDNTTLYIKLLQKMLSGADIDHDENGYYLAASGSVAWYDIYSAMAKGLAKRGAVDDAAVKDADAAVLEEMGQALGCPKEFVPVQLGGKCTLQAERGKKLGWAAQYPPEHILEAADSEVDFILENLKT